MQFTTIKTFNIKNKRLLIVNLNLKSRRLISFKLKQVVIN